MSQQETQAGLSETATELRRIAQILGRRGGLKGGPERAKRLTPEQRSESARKAVRARWDRLTPEQRSEIARKTVSARWGTTKVIKP